MNDTLRSHEVHIEQITRGWEQLTVEISHNTPGAQNYLIISNIYIPQKDIHRYW